MGSRTFSKGKTLAVAGRGEAAAAVMHALSALPGVGTVRQVTEVTSASLTGCDLLVEMLGGVTPAFNAAMTAMGQGMACVTANPLLVAAHGRVLHNAAVGQQAYFGFQAAGFGMPVAEMMTALRPDKVSVSFVSAASVALARMAFRNESLGTVSAHLKMQQVDLSDWGGKVTQARAMALRALWCEEELRGSQLDRVGVESVEPTDVRRLRHFGLHMAFGAEITEHRIYSGPMAVAPGHALLGASQGAKAQDVLVAVSGGGDTVLAVEADDVRRIVGGVVADVRMYLRSVRPALGNEVRRFGPVAKAEAERAFVRVPFVAREQVLAFKPEIFEEHVEGDGVWQAVVGVDRVSEMRLSAVGGMVFPLQGLWEPKARVGLRLVG